MKCPECNGRGLIIIGDTSPLTVIRNSPCRKCMGKGWIPSFWTPAERAGLKALGLHWNLNRDFGGDRDEEIVAAAIQEYVQAARKVKEK